jgi:hypothetical protein
MYSTSEISEGKNVSKKTKWCETKPNYFAPGALGNHCDVGDCADETTAFQLALFLYERAD